MIQRLTSNGCELDRAPERFGEMRDANALLEEPDALRARMAEDGYLLLRGYLDREVVRAARREILETLASVGALERSRPLMEAIASGTGWKPEPGRDLGKELRSGPALRNLVHRGRVITFVERFLGGEVRPFDFIWLRMMKVGQASGFHYDWVYMGRGTRNLYTAWIPIGDVPLSDGPLLILENSHRLEELKRTYGSMDVDEVSRPNPYGGGWLGRDPVAVQNQYGGRWLTTEFRAGDLLVFTMWTLHGSLDNVNPEGRIRLSSDTRYQLASEPADHRWIGEDPIAHGPAAKR